MSRSFDPIHTLFGRFLQVSLSLAVLPPPPPPPPPPAPARDTERPKTARSYRTFPDVQTDLAHENNEPVEDGETPHSIRNDEDIEHWDLGLDEAIHYALVNSRVMRDLGATVLNTPDALRTRYAESIARTDPRYGIAAALSDFDAKFTAVGNFEKNDRALNNVFLGGGTRLLRQDLHTYQAQLSKQSAVGTEFYVGNYTDYNSNNAPGNRFPSAWNSNVELGFRQPLMQGFGTEYNRIAGPKGTLGNFNGVQIARINTKISDLEFELGLRDFLSNVVNCYWDLYFAYRDLDSKIAARDAGLRVWRQIEANKDRARFEADREALAQEQYFRFEEEVQNSLSGKQFDGTRTNNGTTGGTFRATGGVYVAERRLRLLMGVPITDRRLICPSDEPEMTEILFNWDIVISEAKERRPELKRQRLRVERREMEVFASRNFLKPRFDATGRYRFRGFGHYLAGGPDISSGDPGGPFNSAWDNLLDGGYQEWQLGFEVEVPLGFRKAHAAVHNAELQVARERAILSEQERQVIHDLSQSMAEIDRAYAVCKTNLNRYRAARRLLASLEKTRETGRQVDLDKLLDAQRRVADADSRYFLSRVEYALALKNLNFEKGSLLEYYNLVTTDLADTGREPLRNPLPGGSLDAPQKP